MDKQAILRILLSLLVLLTFSGCMESMVKPEAKTDTDAFDPARFDIYATVKLTADLGHLAHRPRSHADRKTEPVGR